MEYEPVIGLEVHVHLKTRTKAFCGCSTEFGREQNSQVCPVCLGLPGSLPVLNKTAFGYAIKVGIALNCTIAHYTKFDRKNYFYPDLPKNYQISQYDLPLASKGFLDVNVDGKIKRIGITRVHLEEDAGKLIHKQNYSLVDYNRSGMPLLEIVSQPEINSPKEAYEYLVLLKSILQYLEVSDCDMEKGSLRCDANVSIRPRGTSGLGTKTELKNMNSFKGVKDALDYEIKRQADVLDSGEKITQETRLWDVKTLASYPMRSKEEAQDYRYFPEPDLAPFNISAEDITEIKSEIPELPTMKLMRFMKDYGLSEYDAKILVMDKKDAKYAEECIQKYPDKDKKPLINWLIGPLLSEANNKNCQLSELAIPGGIDELINLVKLVGQNKISNLTAKSVLSESLSGGIAPSRIIQDKNLFQISDEDSLTAVIDEIIKNNEKTVTDYRQGKTNVVMFLVGQVMRKTSGKANPKLVQDMLKRRLDNV